MPATLLYDAECTFCMRSARVLRRLGVTTEVVPWQSFDLASVSLTPAQADAVLHLVDGPRVYAGHEAVGVALRSARNPLVRATGTVLLSRPARPIASRGYAWVAANRGRLSRLLRRDGGCNCGSV